MVKTRIRDFIITKENWIFAVADYFHPDGIRSVLRYVPDETGDRKLNKIRYRKYDFDDAFQFMRSNRPEWVEDVHIVPEDQVKQILTPPERIPFLVQNDERVKYIVNNLKSAGVPESCMGVTGSMLLGLQKSSSDIDFVVYGNAWFDARRALISAKSRGETIEDISEEMWKFIYNKRKPELSFEEFIVHEKRKGNRGMVQGTYFDLLFVRDWSQIKEPIKRGTDLGYMEIKARVTNSDLAFDSPSVYMIDHNEIDHVLSYTHTYSGQVIEGEIMNARGMVEQVGDIKRLVVGTSREPEGEWIRSLTLLEGK
ncbi:conserved hypothetical protein [Methanosalsum zhilinae DSM 4017]|uniref:Polymerase nucleotidyl transferase domain-containing protein n=1 Tax=Methanosalsum zhilinae (strain DSM 4017 / NBRC 107636 / OCM 62 / WeN5) TaxID=679901 RepID=F7XP06_METZD|nr:nucleotidyltransferase domain-containing protein [Methanosalsum zhilinae]AEH60198.1 conserved hypothetical protein [Methanosalsum zhilinae DSM 4017]